MVARVNTCIIDELQTHTCVNQSINTVVLLKACAFVHNNDMFASLHPFY